MSFNLPKLQCPSAQLEDSIFARRIFNKQTKRTIQISAKQFCCYFCVCAWLLLFIFILFFINYLLQLQSLYYFLFCEYLMQQKQTLNKQSDSSIIKCFFLLLRFVFSHECHTRAFVWGICFCLLILLFIFCGMHSQSCLFMFLMISGIKQRIEIKN